jgi:hypothetical protein
VDNVNWNRELACAGVAAVVAFIIAAILRGNGAGKWLTAGASGAVGGLAAAVVIA